jgi:transposase-like protein
MATIENYKKLSVQERQNRYFSEEFRRKKVREIERNISTIAEICREYQVSDTSVRKWLYKYSAMRKKGIKQVVEAKSDTRKLQQIKDQLKEMERIIGQKQMMIDFQQKVIEQAELEYNIDIKKKFGDKPSYGTGRIEKDIVTK